MAYLTAKLTRPLSHGLQTWRKLTKRRAPGRIIIPLPLERTGYGGRSASVKRRAGRTGEEVLTLDGEGEGNAEEGTCNSLWRSPRFLQCHLALVSQRVHVGATILCVLLTGRSQWSRTARGWTRGFRKHGCFRRSTRARVTLPARTAAPATSWL